MNLNSILRFITGTVLVIFLMQPESGLSQDGQHSGNIFPLYDNLGDFSRTITTDSEQAQVYFAPGMRLGYSFARVKAAESFRAGQQIDPDCAMCYWGEAWVLGPYQNNPAGVGEYEEARQAAQHALERIDGTEPWEQALIEARW